VLESVKHMVSYWIEPKMFLIIPIIMFNGLEMGFIWGDFTQHYIKPTLGKASIGWIMAIFGGSDALMSFLLGKVSDAIGGLRGRMTVLAIGTLAQGAIIYVALKETIPACSDDNGCNDNGHYWTLLSVMAFVWAIGDAAWNTQLNSIISEVFGAEEVAAGSANNKLWQSLAAAAAFFYNSELSPSTKLYVMAVFLALGVLGLLGFCLRFGGSKEDKKAGEDALSEPLTTNPDDIA